MGGAFRGDGFRDALYENPGFGHHYLTVRLLGVESDRFGVGARIRIDVQDQDTQQTRTVYRHVNSGGSFGANPLRQTIGLGNAEYIEKIEVWWPTTNTTQIITDVALDQTIIITEGESLFEVLDLKKYKL